MKTTLRLELKRDIEGLRGKYEKLVAQMEAANESGEGGGEFRMARAQANDSMNALLGKYLPDFAEQNPEISVAYKRSQELEDFVYLEEQGDGTREEKPGRVFGVTALSDGNLAAVGDAIWICRKHEDGEWSVFDRVDLPEDFVYMETVKELKDGRLLIGGNGSRACIYKEEHRDWKEDVSLRGLHTEWNDDMEALAVFAAEELPDGDIAISGEGSGIFIYDGAGEEKEKRPKQEIMWFDKDGDGSGSAHAIVGMPDGTLLAGGEYDDKGIVRIYQKADNGEYELTQEIKDFHDILTRQDTKVTTMARVSDNEVVIGCQYGNVFILYKDTRKDWHLERLEWDEGDKYAVSSAQALPGSGFVVGDGAGMMVAYVRAKNGNYRPAELISEPDFEARGTVEVGSMSVTEDGKTLIASRGQGDGKLDFYNKAPLDVEKLKERLYLVADKAETTSER